MLHFQQCLIPPWLVGVGIAPAPHLIIRQPDRLHGNKPGDQEGAAAWPERAPPRGSSGRASWRRNPCSDVSPRLDAERHNTGRRPGCSVDGRYTLHVQSHCVIGLWIPVVDGTNRPFSTQANARLGGTFGMRTVNCGVWSVYCETAECGTALESHCRVGCTTNFLLPHHYFTLLSSTARRKPAMCMMRCGTAIGPMPPCSFGWGCDPKIQGYPNVSTMRCTLHAAHTTHAAHISSIARSAFLPT